MLLRILFVILSFLFCQCSLSILDLRFRITPLVSSNVFLSEFSGDRVVQYLVFCVVFSSFFSSVHCIFCHQISLLLQSLHTCGHRSIILTTKSTNTKLTNIADMAHFIQVMHFHLIGLVLHCMHVIRSHTLRPANFRFKV